jgi:1-acyl-sn-glycerol-3-phosphate acyltransferase
LILKAPASRAGFPYGFVRRIVVISSVGRSSMDYADLDLRDPDFIREYAAPLMSWLGTNYFRTSFQDVENVPKAGPVVVVGNHGGGPIMPDVFMMAAKWWEIFGPDVPAYAMVHDIAFTLPGIRDFLGRIGAMPASRENASRVLAAGGYVLAFPGGEQEAQRPFLKRDTIDFRGRTGFITTALEYGAPILPVVNVGGHEVYVTLLSSAFLARITGLKALTGLKELPINVGLPWGLWPTAFLPYLPLPAKITYRVGKPFHVPKDPALAKDREYVERLYHEVTSTMQTMVDDLSAERQLPVIG